MNLQLTITDAGRQALISANNAGTLPLNLNSIRVGAGQYTPDPTQTGLQSEIKTLSTFSGDVVGPDTLHVTIRDESADVYTLNEFGIYTDTGVLFAVYSSPDSTVLEKNSAGIVLLSVDIAVTTIDAESLAFGNTDFLLPGGTTDTAGLLKIADDTEALAGAVADEAMTPHTVNLVMDEHVNADTAHDWNQVGNKPDQATRWPAWGEVTGKPTVYPSSSHGHGKSEVGLENVDNTADTDKPVSTATQAALDAKLDADTPAVSAPKLTTARTLDVSLGGDLSGSGSVNFDGSSNQTISITAEVADNSHSHTIANVDGLQAALDHKLEGDAVAVNSQLLDGYDSSAFIRSFIIEDGDGTEVSVNQGKEIKFVEGAGLDINWTDTDGGTDADPNDLTFSVTSAPKLTTARSLGVSLGGDLSGSGSVSFDGTSNQTISISATIADDSHNHTIENVDGLQTALNGKLSTTGKAADSNLLDGHDSSAFIRSFQVEDGDGTEVTINQGKEWKFVEGTGIDINWTDTSPGSDADPFDLTFSVISAPKLTTARTLGVSLGGDLSGSSSVSFDGSSNQTISISATIADDSHNHTIENVDGLQAALNGKLSTTGKAADSNLLDGHNSSAFIRSFQVEDGDGTEVTINQGKEWKFVEGTGIDINWTDTSPGSDADPFDLTFSVISAPKLTTARTLGVSLGGDLSGSGSVSFDGSSNQTISISATIADDSHNHTMANVDGLQTALNGKLSTTGKAADSNLLDGYDSSAFIRSFQVEDGDGTEVTINQGKEWKFVEGTGIDINWTDTSTGSDGDPFDLTFSVTNSPKLNGYSESTGTGGNTIARRDGSGDIYARLFRSTYTNQTTFSGAIAYRISTTNNYIRYCSNPTAVKNWLNIESYEIRNNSYHSGSTVEQALNTVPKFNLINQTLQSTQNSFFNNVKAKGMRLVDADSGEGTIHLNIRVNVNSSGSGDDVVTSGALGAAYRPSEAISFVLTQVGQSTNYYYLHGQIETNGKIMLWECTGTGAYSSNGVFHGHVVYFVD